MRSLKIFASIREAKHQQREGGAMTNSLDSASGQSSAPFEVAPLDPIGAELRGLDLRGTISDDVWAALREAVVREGFVLIREQPMTTAQQVELGRRFGPLENTSLDGGEIDEASFLLTNLDSAGEILAEDAIDLKLVAINEGWHTDSSFRDIPASFSLFAGVVVPAVGGDTFFASLHRGWDALSFVDRAAIAGRRGHHDYDGAYRSRGVDMSGYFGGPAPTAHHPVVRVHPESGRIGLYVSEHLDSIEGFEDGEGRALIARLLDTCTDPTRVYRHQWTQGDLIIWDNRSMLHKTQGFDRIHPRVMRHVRIAGSEPVISASLDAAQRDGSESTDSRTIV